MPESEVPRPKTVKVRRYGSIPADDGRPLLMHLNQILPLAKTEDGRMIYGRRPNPPFANELLGAGFDGLAASCSDFYVDAEVSRG